MSLLSGIKFIPKEKRTSSDDIKSRKDESRKHEKREKHDKYDKRHKSSKHKSKKSSRERERSRDRGNYDSDSSSSVDMMKIAKDEEERERNERYTYNENTRSSRELYKDNDEHVTTKKFDPNHFRSLIDSLKRPSTVSEENVVSDVPVTDSHQNNEDDDYHNTVNNPTTTTITTTTTTGNTNQSAAAMLRDRLKLSKSHLKLPASSSNSEQTLSRDSNFKSNIEINRNIIALKNRLNDKKEEGNIEISSIKKRKSNLPSLDNNDNINTLKYHEKNENENMDDIYCENILRLGGRYKGIEVNNKNGAYGNGDRAGMDEENNDIDMKMFEKHERKSKNTNNLQYEAQKVMKSQEYLRKIVETCNYCTESKHFQLNNILSMGENVYIRVKLDPSVLISGHLEIIPITHISSILQSDEETLIEIERYQLCLKRMFEEEYNQSVLFIETAVHFYSKPHAHIDVIPIELGMEEEASMFFKEAFMSCDEEWAQHKKVIDLTKVNSLKRAIPSHFQYLAVEWGDKDVSTSKETKNALKMIPYGGIVHPVESEHTIDMNFCLDVVAGMMDLEPMRMRRTGGGGGRGRTGGGGAATVSGVALDKVMVEMKRKWSKYDWTQYI